MKKESLPNLALLFFIVPFLTLQGKAQVDPLNSPYYDKGEYAVVPDSNMNHDPEIFSFRPEDSLNGPYPVLIFQLGANGLGDDDTPTTCSSNIWLPTDMWSLS